MDKKIDSTISRFEMGDVFEGAIIGFSGGADSSALLHYLKDRCKNLLAVHVNHMIRGEEAEQDQRTCCKTCEKYGIELVCVRVDIPTLSKERKKGIEETAREERYRIFGQIMHQHPEYKCIVTAHNANDNAETILFNLARGSGANGLLGIKPVLDKVYRPLINVTRDEIIKYCDDNNIEYVTDSTNADTDYTRNYIRHNIIPQMLELNSGFFEACLRTGEILRRDEEYILGEAEKIARLVPGAKLLRKDWEGKDYALLTRALKSACPVTLDYKGTNACLSLLNGWQTGKMVSLAQGITFKVEHDYCAFIQSDSIEATEFCKELKQGINIIETGFVVSVNEECNIPEYKEIGRVSLNSQMVKGSLYARNKRDGDEIRSRGMTKKLKRILSDLHIPSHERKKLPVICDCDGVLAIPGIVARDGAFNKNGDLTLKIYSITTAEVTNEKEK